MRITAKLWRATASSAACPESASTTAWPNGASIARTARRLPALSSTTRTRPPASAAPPHRSVRPPTSADHGGRLARGQVRRAAIRRGRRSSSRCRRAWGRRPWRPRRCSAGAPRPPPCRGDGDDREVVDRRSLAHGPHRLVAVHDRHHDVHEDDVDVRRRLEDVDASCPLSARRLELAALEQRGQREDVAEVVVDDQRPSCPRGRRSQDAGGQGVDSDCGRAPVRVHRERGRRGGDRGRRRRPRRGSQREVDGERAALAGLAAAA